MGSVGTVGLSKFFVILAEAIFESDLHLPEDQIPRADLLRDLLRRQIESYLQRHPEIDGIDQEGIRDLTELFIDLLSDEERRSRWS